MNRRAATTPAVAVAVVSVLVLTACVDRSLPPPDVIARIGGRDLPYADFETYLRFNSVESQAGLSSEVLSGLFDQYLDEILLEEMAADEGFADPSRPRGMAVSALVESEVPDTWSDEQVTDFFAGHREEFEYQESVILRQILVEERAVAERARQAILAGMPFDQAAARFSQGPGAEFGGMQGELARGDLPPAMADLIFALEIGEVSEIVVADYGFHLFQVVERSAASEPDLAVVRTVIEERLDHRSRGEALERLVERARSRYNTSVYARNLPFDYTGFRQ